MNSLILISPDQGEAFNQFFLVTTFRKIATIPRFDRLGELSLKILKLVNPAGLPRDRLVGVTFLGTI